MRTAILVGFLCLCNAVSPGWQPPDVRLMIAAFLIAGLTDTIELLNRLFPRSEG